jgi:cyclophilin family peptidyl-prolyl cis-trans isomerase
VLEAPGTLALVHSGALLFRRLPVLFKASHPLILGCLGWSLCATLAYAKAPVPVPAKPTMTEADIVKGSQPSDWRPLDASNTMLMDVKGTQVIIELAPRFAPQHVANIKALARNGFYAKTSIVRVQDNYVTQWADPNDEDKEKALSLGDARTQLPAEFAIPFKGLPLQRSRDRDDWAPVTGWLDGMPVAADPAANKAWIAHCYGVVGSARGNEADSSNAGSLYVIIGQAPRRLDLNITVVGRVLKGMEALSSLPRGPAPMGFYDKPEMHIPLGPVRMLADVPAAERPALEVMRTDTATWSALVHATRNPASPWFVYRPGHTNICNRSVPVRAVAAPGA